MMAGMATSETAQTNASALAGLRSRIEDFSKIIADDRADREKMSALLKEAPSPTSPPPLPPPNTEPPATVSLPGKQVQEVIRRLEAQATPPQQEFLKRLNEYKEEDKEEWGRHFPPGFRTRIAASFLAQVYAGGQRGKAWAKEYVREKTMADFGASREFIAALSALDTVFLVDKTVGAINFVSTEKLARKALGFYKATQEVVQEKDWKRPPSAAKTWKSKLNWEAARRTDPAYAEDSETFIHREAEEEAKYEIEKDANLLKAFAKVAEWRGAANSSGGE